MAMPPTYIRASVGMIVSGRPCYCILWYNTNVTPVGPDFQTIAVASAGALSTNISAPLKAWLASDCYYSGVELALSVSGNVFTATDTSGAGSGTGGVDALPAYAAAIIQKRTLLSGRSGRGRWYLPGCPEGFTANSALTPAGQTALGDVANGFFADVSSMSGTYHSCHHFGTGDGSLSLLIAVRPLVTLGTMRRRMVQARF